LIEVATTIEETTTSTIECDRHSQIMAAWALQTELGRRHLSNVANRLVAHNFGKRAMWMVA
jgi:hypothetical protein